MVNDGILYLRLLQDRFQHEMVDIPHHRLFLSH